MIEYLRLCLVLFLLIFIICGVILIVAKARNPIVRLRAGYARLMAAGAGSLITASLLGLTLVFHFLLSPILQLQFYDRVAQGSGQVMQVDLSQHWSISQYTPEITDPSLGNFGFNACGLVASAQAVSRSNASANLDSIINRMHHIRSNAVRPDGSTAYHPATGIQPSDLHKALRSSGMEVSAHNRWHLTGLYQALADGDIVIVDLRVNREYETPSTEPETFAHFARVLGMDIDEQLIYIENTLNQREGVSYWTLTFDEFLEVWEYPETRATSRPSLKDPSVREENVTRWALIIQE